MLTGSITAACTVADARRVGAAPSVASYIVRDFVPIDGRSIFASMRHQWRPCAAAGASSIVTYTLALAAPSIDPTAPLAASREKGRVSALLIAILALDERVTWQRSAAVLGILAGAALVTTG